MHLKFNQTMATAIEQLVIDSQSRFLEMKSLQPFSTKDEYLYAMKEDLADWLANMYPDWCPITADNFLECLENGALLCHHANNVNEAARKAASSSTSSLTNCKYRSDARPKTFNARDNVSQFIKWSRRIACVREVLMFESDDLILRKNEKNFILCLLEIARFGAKFGFSVPHIIKLEQEIEREIERDKQKEKLSRSQGENDEDNQNNQFDTTNYQSIDEDNQYDTNNIQSMDDESEKNQFNTMNYQSVDDENEKNQFDTINYPPNDDENQKNQFDTTNTQSNDNDNNNQLNTISLSNSNDANLLQQQQQQQQEEITRFSNNNNNSKQRQGNEESYDSRTSNEVPKAIITSNEEPQFSRTLIEKQKPAVPPVSASYLHKTVVKITNSCCCSQRFPVIRIGEGKYRIGENGTIIFIRILRNHVMVRVGGGWDTLENYLNKHDPCRRSGGHRRNEHHHDHHHHHSDIPILAIPNTHVSSSVQKNTPFGKSVTIKTEEFPLAKPSIHDTNLVDAQLVITRGADGRHRIGQITYKSEEDLLNQPPTCPHHHHHNQSPPLSSKTSKIKTARSTENLISSSTFNKQSSPSTDQDYSSLTETPTHSKPSSSSSLDFKDDSIEQSIASLDLTLTDNRPRGRYPSIQKSHTEPLSQIDDQSIELSTQNFTNKTSGITESIIGNIDGYIHSTSNNVQNDFDINDIEDVMRITKKSNSHEHIDNDSLESSEGVLEEKKKPSSTTKKSTGYTSAFYLAEKQKYQQEQIANRKRLPPTNLNRYSSRSTTLSNILEPIKKDEQTNRQRRKPMIVTNRSLSTELIEKTNDISKLDRDSGFDEQDFRRERLQSNGDDNSSISSIKSTKNSAIRSSNIEIRENKSYELRMKKLDTKRNSIEKDSTLNTPKKNLNISSRRTSEFIPQATPTTPNKYRKSSQPNVNIKQQTQNEKN